MKQGRQDAVAAVEQSCREFERQLVIAADSSARGVFDAAVERRESVPSAAKSADFLKGLPKGTQLALLPLIKKLSPASPRLHASIGRKGAGWTHEEQTLVTTLHTHGAKLETVARSAGTTRAPAAAGLSSWGSPHSRTPPAVQ